MSRIRAEETPRTVVGVASTRMRKQTESGSTARERESREFQRLVVISLLPFLMFAVVAKLTGWRWKPWPAGAEGRQSVVREAWQAAETSIAFSYMGW